MSLGLALLLAGAAVAAEPEFTPEPTEACLAAAGEPAARPACIGRAAEACAGGAATHEEVAACFGHEADFWAARVEVATATLDAVATSPEEAAALAGMQGAWAGFRDAACGFEAARWGEGAGQAAAVEACLMRRNGAQALALEEWLRQASGP